MSERSTTWTRSRRALCAFAAVIVFGFGFSIVLRVCQQRDAIDRIERLGGNVWTEPVGPIWLSDYGIGIERVDSVDLSQTQITDRELQLLCQQHLSRFSHLKVLSLVDTNIGDKGIIHLNQLKGLRGLHISHTQVSDQGLQNLHGLLGLKGLSLEGSRVTEEGLHSISRALPDCRIYHNWRRPQAEGTPDL